MLIDIEILSGKICPYCNRLSKYVNSKVVYGKDFGMMYRCAPCDAHVGVHKGTDKALGRLANNELRVWKNQTHRFFDNLWQRAKIEQDREHKEARQAAYQWLADELGLSIEFCHIGMFDIDTCKKVIDLCKPYYKPIKKT